MSDPSAGNAFIDRATERASFASTVRGVLRYRELVRNLVLRDLRVKYRGSILGVAWSLMNPIVLVGASTLAFKYILRIGPERYPFFVLIGVLAWSFFTNSANMSTRSIIDGAGLLKSVRFPRSVLPLATVLFNLAQYLLAMTVFMPVMLIAYGVPLSLPMLAFPAILVLQVVFTIGVALLLSAATVFFRDIRHLVEVLLSVLFWTTPVVYSLGQAAEPLRPWLQLSPMSPFVVGYHQVLYEGAWPSQQVWLLAIGYAVASLVIGASVFLSREDSFAEQL